jgi:glycosyltransferase involved in cell wall biosynthesis
MVSISVVMATYNAGKVLASALDAFRAQGYKNAELLIADGGSTDDTVEIISQNRDIISWFISEPDNGIFDAWNKGVKNAKGEWLYFMGADDTFVDGSTLGRAADILSKLPSEILVAYGSVQLVDTAGNAANSLGSEWRAKRFRSEGMTIPHQGVFTRASYFTTYGLFDATQKHTATYEFYLRHLAKHDAYFIQDFVVSNMGVGGVSTRPENQLKFMNAYVYAQLKHRTFRITFRFIFYYMQALFKALIYSVFPKNTATSIVEGARFCFGRKRHFHI